MRIGFMGRTKILLNTINLFRKLTEHEISFVWTSKSEEYYGCKEKDFENLSEKMNCRYIFSSKTKAIKNIPDADIVISNNFVNLIPESFLKRFKFGILNAHAGSLQNYKGNACANWSIINNERDVTVSIFKMNKKLDSGPVYLKSKFNLTPNTYITEIYDWFDIEIPKLFLNAVRLIQEGIKPNDQKGVSFRTFPRIQEDSKLDFKNGVDWIYKVIRASSDPFQGAYCFLKNSNKRIIIKRANPIKLNYNFCAADGQLLEFRRNTKNFIVSSKNKAIEIQEYSIDGLSKSRSFDIISKSIRNRLI